MAMMLIDGVLAEKPRSPDGRFQRFPSKFRHWIKPAPEARFPAEADRYHLFISPACPWCHRVMILRSLKGLETIIPVTYLEAQLGEKGWKTDAASHHALPGLHADRYLYETYLRADPGYTGFITAPLLLDRKSGLIVSNESADIMRMFNEAFNDLTGNRADFYPPSLRSHIDRLNDFVQDRIAEGVYRAGFATSQEAYDTAVDWLADGLEHLDELLGEQRYLAGDCITEADWRLYPALVRFDPVYFLHFRAGQRRIADHPNLSAYLRDLHQMPGIAETVDMEHIRRHYFLSHRHLNPTGIIPIGPQSDLTRPHGRDSQFQKRAG